MILLLGGRMTVFWNQDMALLIVIYIIALHQGYTYVHHSLDISLPWYLVSVVGEERGVFGFLTNSIFLIRIILLQGKKLLFNSFYVIFTITKRRKNYESVYFN